MSESRIKVGMFTNALVRGGAEEHILTLLRGLDRQLFEPAMICPPALAAKLAEDLPSDVTLVPIEFGNPSFVRGAARLFRYLRRKRLDILHSHLFYSSLFASPVAQLCGVPVVIETPHVNEAWRKGWKRSHVIDRIAGRFVDHYIAVSEANRRYLVDTKGLPGKKVGLIHNGCDLRRFDPAHRVPAPIRATLGFAEGDRILLIVGRLEPQKGHSIALQALAMLAREFSYVRLVCVGEGALRSELEAQAEQLGLQAAVRFLGFQSNVQDWLALADVVVLPSHYEGLPLSAIEALAAARPLVATAVDGTPEIVIDGQTGLLVPPSNPGSLAQAIARLLRDPALARGLAREGRRWVEERFSEEKQIRATERLYFQALGRPYPERVQMHEVTCAPAESR